MNTSPKQPAVTLVSGAGNLPKVELVAPDGARAEVYLNGAQITSWVPAGSHERLYLSAASQFRDGVLIRGGIPVVFPQFAALGPLPMHGFAQIMPWEFAGAQSSGGRAAAIFRLRDTPQSRSLWPYAFLCELTVVVGGSRLEVTLGVTNTGTQPFDFTASLHTYFRIVDISTARVEGMFGRIYRDAAAGMVEKQDGAPRIEFTGEVDRIYFDSPTETRLVEPHRTTVIRQAGFTDTVVWNPGAEKCAPVADMQPDDYRRFVCIEAATIGAPPRLVPGARRLSVQTILA